MAQNINTVPTSDTLTDKDYLIGSVDNKLRRVPKSFFAKLLPDGVNEKFSVLESRMDTFSALENGSTTGDAELMDGRTDNTGKTWANIGRNIRHTQDTLSGIFNINNFITIDPEIVHIDNGYNDFNGVWHASSDYRAIVVNCKPGDIFFYRGYMDESIPMCCVLKSNGYLEQSFGKATQLTKVEYDKYIVIPPNGVKVVFNFQIKSYGDANYGVKKATEPKGGTNWSHLKWACVGDSLTEKNLRSEKNYHDYISEKTGIKVTNLGISGTGYKSGEERQNAFYQKIVNVANDTSVITIFGSGNDKGYVLGSPTDPGTTTICGCVNTALDIAYDKGITVGIISPTPWNGQTPDNPDCFLYQYTEALKQICERRGIPFLDLFRLSGFKANDLGLTHTRYFSKDPDGTNIHPNELGHKVISSRIFNFLQSLIGTY